MGALLSSAGAQPRTRLHAARHATPPQSIAYWRSPPKTMVNALPPKQETAPASSCHRYNRGHVSSRVLLENLRTNTVLMALAELRDNAGTVMRERVSHSADREPDRWD